MGKLPAEMPLENHPALDKPVAQWLPDFAAGGKDSVTLRQVLTHTSGLPDYVTLWTLEPTPEARIQREKRLAEMEAFAGVDVETLATPTTRPAPTNTAMMTSPRPGRSKPDDSSACVPMVTAAGRAV